MRRAVLFFFNAVVVVWGHVRLECPPPRTGNTGAKAGPCDAADDPSLPAHPLIPNALNTITWLESIGHPGAPARFALSLDGADDGFEQCLLLDMVPHDELSRPRFRDETTFHRSSITLWIPDIYCERCHLQLLSIMSDVVHGVPSDTYCVYKGAQEAGLADPSLPACPVVYHSCAPVSINGTIPRNSIETCNTKEFESILDWPFMKIGNNQNYSTYYEQGNPGIFNQTDARLLAGGNPLEECSSYSFCDPELHFDEAVVVPATARYTTLAGACAAIVGMEVEPFVLGKLPDKVVFEVEMGGPHNMSLCESYNCTDMLEIDEKYIIDMGNVTGEIEADVIRRGADSKEAEESSSPSRSNGVWGPLAGLVFAAIFTH